MEEESHKKIAASALNSCTWDQIELSESYLVCGMFKEAADLASSILGRLHENKYNVIGDEILLCDMMTSAAMVLVQSWKESGRTSDLFNELKNYFGSATAVPVQVVLTGACVQVSGGHSSEVRSFLDHFLAKWKLDNDKYHVISHRDLTKTDVGVSVYDNYSTLEVDEYLEVVEFYALTLLCGVLNNVDHAVLWVEKAQLPEEARQDLLRRLLSLSHLKSTSCSVPSSLVDEPESPPLSVKEVKQSDEPMMVLGTQFHNGLSGLKLLIRNWLQNITKRSSNAVVASNGKILMGCLIFLICYFLRKKRDSITRIVRRRALSLKQAVMDIWRIAFSYQVNPLAAVQPLPSSANRSW